MAKKSTSLGRLLPKSVTITLGDDSVLLPGNAAENKILGYFMAAQMRNLFETSMKDFKDKGITMTPREMRDLAEAGRALAEFSAELYKGEESAVPALKQADKAQPDDLSFDSLKDERSKLQETPQPDKQ